MCLAAGYVGVLYSIAPSVLCPHIRVGATGVLPADPLFIFCAFGTSCTAGVKWQQRSFHRLLFLARIML